MKCIACNKKHKCDVTQNYHIHTELLLTELTIFFFERFGINFEL